MSYDQEEQEKMTKSEIQKAVLSTFPNILNVEIREDAPFTVTIVVTVGSLAMAEDYDLRTSIMQLLEPDRPVGVGFEVLMIKKSFDDSLVTMTFANPPVAAKQRSQFDAVWEELTEPIKPVNKPQPGREPVNQYQRYLFEQNLRVEGGIISPCPKCGCQAFTPDSDPLRVRPSRVICRRCPLPAPVHSIEYVDRSTISTNEYRCGSCGKQSLVTLALSQANFWCGSCDRLKLHDMKVIAPTLATSRWVEPGPKPGAAKLDSDLIYKLASQNSPKQTKVFSGAKATFMFDGKAVGFASDVEAIEYEPVEDLNKEADKGFYGIDKGFNASFTMTSDKPFPFFEELAKLTDKVSSEYGMTYEELAKANPIADLVEEFRKKLDLLPFKMFAANQYNENTLRLAQYDWERRTGRTTRGLIEKIAEFMVSDRRWFFVVGHTERYTMDLANLARDMHSMLNLSRELPVKMISPTTFYRDGTVGRLDAVIYVDRDGTVGRLDAVIYVDHTWNERRSTR